MISRVLAGVAAVGVALGVVWGGYEGGWWLQQNAAVHSLNIQQHVINRQNKIVRSSYEFTTTQLQQMQSDLNFIAQEDVALQSDPNNTAIISEIEQYKQSFCQTYDLVVDPTQVPPALTAAATAYHCTAVPSA